jgi:hypothetical protein
LSPPMSTTKGYLHLAGSSPLAIRRLTPVSDSFSRSATPRTVSSCGVQTSVSNAPDYRRSRGGYTRDPGCPLFEVSNKGSFGPTSPG